MKSRRLELPQWISAGDGASLIINRKISILIRELADTFYLAQPARAISRNDWAGIVRRVIGPVLGKTDIDASAEANAASILNSLRRELETTEWNYNRRTFLFGCSLIEHHEIPPFVIGPVTIWRRESWLDHALAKGQISRVSRRRLAAQWAGRPIKRRKRSQDEANEQSVADAIGAAPYICTVETEGLFGETAKEKAAMAARLTLVGVALIWASPTKAMANLNLMIDGPPYIQTHAFFQDRPDILGGRKWVRSLHGLSLFGDLWEPIIQQRADWWVSLAEVVSFWLSPDGKVLRPRLMPHLVQALIWFHEACREPLDTIATTKFMAALDALACGKGIKSITALVSSRLGVTADSPIRANGPSFSSAIHDLYSQGRSRLIHGTSDRIGHDWQEQRALAESLARITLIMCLQWAADHPNVDDPASMAKP